MTRRNYWRRGSCQRGTSCVFRLAVALAPFDTFGRIPLVVRQESGRALLLLRALCAHPQRTNTNKGPQQRPSAHLWGAGPASLGNWRTGSKTAAPSLSCICHNCDLMEQSGNAVTRWGWLFHSHSSHCSRSPSLYLCPRALDDIFEPWCIVRAGILFSSSFSS